MIAAIGRTLAGADKLSATSSTTPARPIPSPIIVRAEGLLPLTHSMTISQNGSVATSSAAMPDEIRSSAHASAA